LTLKFTILVFLIACSFSYTQPQSGETASPIPISPGTISTQGELIRIETPTLKWKQLPGTSYYEITLSRQRFDGSFDSILGEDFNAIIFDTIYTIKSGLLDRNGIYKWSVRANDGKSWTNFSHELYLKYESAEVTRYIPEIISNQPEEIFVSLKYAGIIKETIAGFYDRDKIFIPIIELFDLLEINKNVDLQNKIITGFYISRTELYNVDIKKQRANIGNTSTYFTKDDFFSTDFDFYFTLDFYKNAFNLELDFDLSNLTINVNSSQLLPIYLRLSRERTYAALDRKRELESIKLHYGRDRKIFNAGILDYHFTNNLNKNARPSGLYRFGLAGEVAGGDIQAYSRGIYNASKFTDNETEVRWRYVLDNNYIKSISIGNLEFNGLDFSNIEGININNEPLEPRKEFSTKKIIEFTNPNWTVEIYINNQLFEISKADATGSYSFNLPLTYGTTLVQKKYYGPTGEYYSENKLYQTPFVLLKPEEFNYNISYGKQKLTNYHLANIKSSYGFSEWLTGSLGVEYFQKSNKDKPIFFNALTGRYAGSYLINLMIAPDVFYRFSANAQYYSQVIFNIDFTHFASTGYFNPANLNKRFTSQFFFPVRSESYQLNFRSSFDYSESDLRKSYEIQLGSSASIASFNPAINLRYNYFDFPTDNFESVFLDLGFTVSLRKLTELIPILQGNIFTFRNIYDISNGEFSNLTAAFSAGLFKNSRIQISHSRFFQSTTNLTQLQFVVYFPFTQYSGSLNDISYTHNLLGSVSYNMAANNLHFYERQQIGRSAAAFRMFIDENGNETFDEKEQLIEDAWLNIGTSVVRREGRGTILARELDPYTTYAATILEESIKNPVLIPKENKFSFTTDPNSIKQIDIPFYISGEISGVVSREIDSIKSNIAGMKLYIESIENNSIISVITFSNGSYYYFGLKPGQYRIYLDSDQIESLGLKSHPSLRLINIEADPNGDILEEINFVLKP
jgi:hypothetical protein